MNKTNWCGIIALVGFLNIVEFGINLACFDVGFLFGGLVFNVVLIILSLCISLPLFSEQSVDKERKNKEIYEQELIDLEEEWRKTDNNKKQ